VTCPTGQPNLPDRLSRRPVQVVAGAAKLMGAIWATFTSRTRRTSGVAAHRLPVGANGLTGAGLSATGPGFLHQLQGLVGTRATA
jgi:hypothetical protein